MSAQFSTPTDELLLLAETLGEVKSRTEKLETEFSTQARPLEAATNALSAALSGIKALQFHVLDNNLGALSARVEEMRKAVDEQVGVIALELKKADETNAAKAGADAEALRFEILALESKLESLVTQFGQQLERVEFAAKEEAKKLQLIPGPAGAAGASLNPRGTFIDGETYNRLDVVSWLGSSYIATVDGVTEKPSKNSNQWQTLASRGSGAAGGVNDINSLLPTQFEKAGSFLITDGVNPKWSGSTTDLGVRNLTVYNYIEALNTIYGYGGLQMELGINAIQSELRAGTFVAISNYGSVVSASGEARLYVDTDGDLKVIFSNGVVKTLATN